MSGEVVDLSREDAPEEITTEICVIGSGCGGATAAWVLAERGHDVVVLEEGRDMTGPDLTQRDTQMYDQLYMDRGGRSTEDLAISVLQGRVLGGGGVINASDVVPIPDGVLHHWSRDLGLSDFTPERLSSYREMALSDLSASRITSEEMNRANGLLRQGTEALGWRGELMLHNRTGCIGLGTCLIGCPVNAKRNPRFVAIPGALAAGARFYTRARAVRIEGAGAGTKRVEVRVLDEPGYRERGSLTVKADVVVIAANAVATPQLLLGSGIGNRHVGRGLMLQPQLPVVAYFDEQVRAFEGIPQSWAITEFEQEDHPERALWGFRIEGIMGTPGIVASLLPWSGRRGEEAMAGYDRIAASLVLVPDAPSGTVALADDGRPVVRYDHRDEHKARMREGAKAAARAYLAAGATRVVVPTVPPVEILREADLARIDEISLRPASAPMLSAHQQGSVRMAPSERDGAADPSGLVYGTRDVYVLDSSLFPSSSSSHIMTPILTVSRMLAEQISAGRG